MILNYEPKALTAEEIGDVESSIRLYGGNPGMGITSPNSEALERVALDLIATVRQLQGIPAAGAHTFRLSFPPSANVYWRVNPKTGRPYATHEAKKYKERAGMEALAQGVKGYPLEQAVSLKLDFYFPTQQGDLSNRVKILEDALQGIAYANDNQIVHEETTLFRMPPARKVKGKVIESNEGFVICTLAPANFPEPDWEALGLLI